MKKLILSLFLAMAGCGLLTTSCQDMLMPELDRYTENFSGKDTVNFYFGILRNVQGMIEQNVLLGELRGDLVTPTEFISDSVNNILNFTNLHDGSSQLLNRSAYYKVINQCNFYLARVDSMALKNNSYYMRREMAQVQLIRAWTYMQLVQNYGKVPFITHPVSNSDTGWDSNPPEGWVDSENLLSVLEEKGGLRQAYAYSQTLSYPSYGDLNTGAGSFFQRLTTFNANLIYGDLYLLRSSDLRDYQTAAEYYHKYLDEDTKYFTSIAPSSFKIIRGKETTYMASAIRWRGQVLSFDFGKSASETITAVPSGANSFFGTVLTRIPQIYGFDPNSTNSSTTKEVEEKGKKKDQTTTTGRIVVTANYRNRQVGPSAFYLNLNTAQTFVFNEFENSELTNVKYPSLGDQRVDESAPFVTTEKGRMRFIQKFTPASSFASTYSVRSFDFRYGIPVYRLRQIYLRYAEAINRAGFPRYAFDILRSGIYPNNLPGEHDSIQADTTYTDATKAHIAGIKISYYPSLSSVLNGDKSIDYNSLARAKAYSWLDFTKFADKKSLGIHSGGCGVFLDNDTVWVYEKVVAQRMVDEAARQGRKIALPDLKPSMNYEFDHTTTSSTTDANGDTYPVKSTYYKVIPTEPSADEIAAVETLIADELALETAFEGGRFYDLMRIQRHRNTAGNDTQANSWMAWLISRRGLDLAPYAEPSKTGALFNVLLNQDNWFLPSPVNN